MIRKFITALSVLSAAFVPLHAANVVTVHGAEANVGQRVEMSVDLTTDADDVAAVEIHIPLPDAVVPVEGSCVRSDTRLPYHQVSAGVIGNEYVLIFYNSTLRTVPAGSGCAVTFSVDLGANPGVFDLTPSVKISDAAGRQLSASGVGGQLTVRGARLELDMTDIDFGRVPVKSVCRRSVTARNTGTVDLVIGDITTDVPGLSVSSAKTTVAPGAQTNLAVTYSPVERAPYVSGRFTVMSNSVVQPPFVTIGSIPFSVNELHVGSAAGVSDSEIVVSLSMDNMEPIVGVDITIPLPEGLEYVDGSLTPLQRAASHSAAAYFDRSRNLRIVLFSPDNSPVDGETGDMMSFRLSLTGHSSSYALNPSKVVLTNASGENMVSEVTSGSVTIQSPAMVADDSMELGDVAVSGSDTFDYVIYNAGSVPLVIEKVSFLSDIASSDVAFPLTVAPRSSGKLPVSVNLPSLGRFSTVMNIYSNDPDNRLKSVVVSGNLYSPNAMSVDGYFVDDRYDVVVAVDNEAEIVAMQVDIEVPQGLVLTESDFRLQQRASHHTLTVAAMASNVYRVIVYSLTNTPFAGNAGPVFMLSLDAASIKGRQLLFRNITLSNPDGCDFTTPGSQIMAFDVPLSGISEVSVDDTPRTIYSIGGLVIKENATSRDLESLPAGLYIVGNKECVVK